jgi:hypothetical protein
MIFWENESSFSLEAIPLKSFQELDEGLWLALVGINEVPPHIAILSDSKYYSLSTRKVDCGNSIERILDILYRKNIHTLFIRINTKNKVRNYVVARNEAISINLLLGSIYKDLRPLNNAENTCLSPVKEFFASYYSEDFSNVNYVFELLALAERKGLIKECSTINTIENESNRITLPKYTMAQIRNKISALYFKSEIPLYKS